MPSGLCSLLLLASLGVMVASKTDDLQVTFSNPPYTTLSIKAKTGCTNTTKDNMTVRLGKCPMKEEKRAFPKTATGVCQKNGAKFCVPPYLWDASCIAVVGEMDGVDGVEYKDEVTVPPNVTFYKDTWPAPTSWTQKGNTSKMQVRRLDGVPIYKLVLKPVDSNKGADCKKVTLTGKQEEDARVVFRAHWHQQVFPGCSYKALFQPTDECGVSLAFDKDVDKLLEYVSPTDETIQLKPQQNRAIYGASVGAAASLSLALVVLLLVTLHHRKRRQPSATNNSSTLGLSSKAVPSSQQTTVLLMYTHDLHPQMAALAARLNEMTGLQIEDLHDVGDQDKLNDPTVWLTRRLTDPNTRFVLACSPARPGPDDTQPNGEPQEAGVVHYLLHHFLQHLHSSTLASDYTRLHVVSFEGQPQVDMGDATPGRVYQLPVHLPQLARNLSLATAAATTTTTGTSPPPKPSTVCQP